ncbi:hypothetical protein MferCBS31731_005019 [Microsporum ferrugineum]
MAPGSTSRDEMLMTKWLASREVKNYMRFSIEREVAKLPPQKNKCKQSFAKLFYEEGPPRAPYVSPVLPGCPQTKWETFKTCFEWLCLRFWQWLTGENPGNTLTLLVALVARFISLWTKKAARDLLKSGSGFLWPYLLGEIIVCAALIVQQRMAADPRNSNHRSSLVISASGLAAPLLDTIASIYLGNLESFANSNAVSIIGKLVCDILVAIVTFIPMWQDIMKWRFNSVLSRKPKKPLELWDQVPVDYKYWAMDSLGNYHDQYIEGSRETWHDDRTGRSSYRHDDTRTRARKTKRTSSAAPRAQQPTTQLRPSTLQQTEASRSSSAHPRVS